MLVLVEKILAATTSGDDTYLNSDILKQQINILRKIKVGQIKNVGGPPVVNKEDNLNTASVSTSKPLSTTLATTSNSARSSVNSTPKHKLDNASENESVKVNIL